MAVFLAGSLRRSMNNIPSVPKQDSSCGGPCQDRTMTISNEETLERPVTFARRGARGTTARFRAGYAARLAHAAGTTLYESFEAAEPVWRDFEARAAGTAFQSFDWLSIWHRHVGERLGIEPAIAVVM